jgi:hypothetical protein
MPHLDPFPVSHTTEQTLLPAFWSSNAKMGGLRRLSAGLPRPFPFEPGYNSTHICLKFKYLNDMNDNRLLLPFEGGKGN